MSPHMHWWIEEQERRAVRDIEMAARSSSHARTLEELARAKGQVSVSPMVRNRPAVHTAKMALEQAADRRAESFCDDLIQQLSAAPADAAVRAKVGAAYRSCCGVFPRQGRRLFDTLTRSRKNG